MTKLSFQDFVTAKASEVEEAARAEKAIDWNKEKQDWITHLQRLKTDVTKWLDPYSETIQVSTKTIPLSEELLGTYSAPMTVITIGKDAVNLEPIGTLLIGSRGRVDIKGPKGTARLVLVPMSSTGIRVHVEVLVKGQKPNSATADRPPFSEWVWKLVIPPPANKFVELTEDSFQEVLMRVVNG
jgi:hypothetical protein